MKDYLIDLKNDNNKHVFLGIEQGVGKYAANVLVVYAPKMKQAVHK